jgi:hypothetical protein
LAHIARANSNTTPPTTQGIHDNPGELTLTPPTVVLFPLPDVAADVAADCAMILFSESGRHNQTKDDRHNGDGHDFQRV